MNNWINCCGVAIFLALANVLQLVFFFNYSLKLKDKQVILEKKNGKEQKQIEELKAKLDKKDEKYQQLKGDIRLIKALMSLSEEARQRQLRDQQAQEELEEEWEE